jgi:lipopolysaccharide/colanic/teichoic acid biosynthesis glycosyltransferase
VQPDALLIKLQDHGPVLFRQQRVGLHGHIFEVLKLRTMVLDAEVRLASLTGLNQRSGGPLFKLDRDPRVTCVGRVLRATSIDELPQLVNVLRGKMSLVGPRPPLVSEYEEFDEELRQRQDQVPGITGLWQLEARDNPSFSTYRRLDLYYVRNWSLSLDLMILLLTAYAVAIRAFAAAGRAVARRWAVPVVMRGRWRLARIILAAFLIALSLIFTQAMLARALSFPGLDQAAAAAPVVVAPAPDATTSNVPEPIADAGRSESYPRTLAASPAPIVSAAPAAVDGAVPPPEGVTSPLRLAPIVSDTYTAPLLDLRTAMLANCRLQQSTTAGSLDVTAAPVVLAVAATVAVGGSLPVPVAAAPVAGLDAVASAPESAAVATAPAAVALGVVATDPSVQVVPAAPASLVSTAPAGVPVAAGAVTPESAPVVTPA